MFQATVIIIVINTQTVPSWTRGDPLEADSQISEMTTVAFQGFLSHMPSYSSFSCIFIPLLVMLSRGQSGHWCAYCHWVGHVVPSNSHVGL